MFDPNAHEDTTLEKEIDRVHTHLTSLTPDSDEYEQTIDQISKLYALRNANNQLSLQAQKEYAAHELATSNAAHEKEQTKLPFYKRVDPNTALSVAGSLLTAVIVVKYEQTGVISTKAMSFMRKF